MATKQVVDSWATNLVGAAPAKTDFFYHLFVGTELSARGQSQVTSTAAADLAQALEWATQVRLQYTENDFTCEQMTTGRFFKLASCAQMIWSYEQREQVNYSVILFLRPDLVIKNPMPDLRRCKTPGERWWMSIVEGDVLAISGDALQVALSLVEAECCDTQNRTPRNCFIQGLQEPRANFMLMRHFSMHLRGTPNCWPFPQVLVRTPEMLKNHANNPFKMHGKYRQEVIRHKQPDISRTVEFKDNSTREARIEVLASLLEPKRDGW